MSTDRTDVLLNKRDKLRNMEGEAERKLSKRRRRRQGKNQDGMLDSLNDLTKSHDQSMKPNGRESKQQSRDKAPGAPSLNYDDEQMRVSDRRSIPYKEEDQGAPDKGGAIASAAKRPPSLNMNNLIEPPR